MKSLALCSLAALSSCLGAAGAHLVPRAPQQRELTLESLRLVDGEGRVRMVIGPLGGGSFGPRLLDEGGTTRASLELARAGTDGPDAAVLRVSGSSLVGGDGAKLEFFSYSDVAGAASGTGFFSEGDCAKTTYRTSA